MKKYLKFKFILLIFLINTAYANAQCNLEFDIGDNQSIAFESLGLYEDYIIDTENEKQYSYIEDNYKELCPDGDMEDAKIRVLINEQQVKGIKIISLVDINFQDDEKKLIYYYIKKYFNDVSEVASIDDPSWIGSESWDRNGKKYYYTKQITNQSSLIREEFLITNEKFKIYIW